ncbi:hypothetical protein TL16_g13038 [Triparma laevis f. inornata]|uniref:AMP-dependent synthetase/ligase domain-containing protein n=1 Tax=Triparma laevis f. inornata TaxID=1714386 RepID=A0A9W7BV02_9STRA|nr:hypothetical protein TL16_g13038 [Triparma laevis f. inornata]
MVLVPRVLEKIASGIQAKVRTTHPRTTNILNLTPPPPPRFARLSSAHQFKSGSPVQKAIVNIVTKAGLKRNAQRRILNNLVEGSKKAGFRKRLKAKLTVAALSPLCAVGDKLVWSKVKTGFGGSQKVIISGGSALSSDLELFYDLAGIPIIVGYGLTETSPLIGTKLS